MMIPPYSNPPLRANAVEALFRAIEDERESLILSVLLDTGLRLGEFAALTPEEAFWVDDLTISPFGALMRVRDRQIPLPGRSRLLLKLWFARYGDMGYGPRTWQTVLQQLAERAGMEGVTAEALRHTYALRRVTDGADIREVQRWMGHDSLRSTERCLVMAEQDGDEEGERGDS